MRIACIFAPHVPLQALVRRRPELRKQPVAVVSGGPASAVLACSRAAHGLGVRVGISAIAARQLSVEVQIELRDLEAEAQLEVAMVEALYGVSPRVEAEGLRRGARRDRKERGSEGGAPEPAVPGAATLFCEVPTGMRGATFGARVLEVAAVLDVAVRIGIADDRFTAWVSARFGAHAEESPIAAIPRGGSAAFLAPQPLSLLDISPEVQQMLAQLGVRTLGEFASLPAPSVARRWDCDLQGLARGEGGAELISVKPESGPLREEVAVGGEVGVGVAVAILAERVALRLAGRGGVAQAMEVTSHSEGGAESATLWLVPPLHQAEELADRIGRAVGDGHVQRLGIVVTMGQAADAAPSAVEGAAVSASGEGAAVTALASAAVSREGARGAARLLDEALEEPVTPGMSGALLRWSEAGAELKAHRRTRRGKQRRRIVSTQARLFGGE